MTPADVHRRLDAGEDPLEVSIKKWEDILYHHGVDDSKYNCALCHVFNDGDGCGGCPVAERSDEDFCGGTPYDNWSTHLGTHLHKRNRIHCPECSLLALAELEFLKSLRVVGT